jgi:hypothetical protein
LMATPKSRLDGSNEPIIQVKTHKASSCILPLCVACQVAKQARRGPETTIQLKIKEKDKMLRRDHLEPGQMVSVDQYVSALPGRLPNMKGKETKKDKYCGGTIFVDHASSKVFIKNQVSLNAGETVMDKRAFEREAMSNSVTIRGYHADNVPFNSQEWRNDINSKNQGLPLSGTGAHHQNGIAKRTIKTIVSWARAMLLHAVLHWPEQADLTLWPFALEYAIFIWNHLPNQQSTLCPEEIFSGSKVVVSGILCRLRVWGCPVYVLDPRLQDGKKLPKWHPRARRGMFLGFSTQHSSTVGRILNLVTGYISPHYHVVYGKLFSTVTTTQLQLEALGNNNVFTLEHWNDLITSGYERNEVLIEAEQSGLSLPRLENDWLFPAEIEERESLRARRAARKRLARAETDQEGIQEPEEIIGQLNPGSNVQPVPVTVQVPQNEEQERQNTQPEQVVVDKEDSSTVQTDTRSSPLPTVRNRRRRRRAKSAFHRRRMGELSNKLLE